MKKSYRLVALMVLLVLVAAILSSVASLITAQTNEGIRTATHQRTGKLAYVGASVASPIQIAQATADGLSAEARASAILAVYAPQFGVANPAQDLTFMSEFTTSEKLISRRYQQTYQGIPVFAGELIINTTRAGGLVSMFGEASPDLAVNIQPKLTAAQAQQLAIQKSAKDFSVSATSLSASAPALWIYDERLLTASDEEAALVWRVEVRSTSNFEVNAVVLVDARKGYISLIYNRIDDRWNVGNVTTVSAPLSLPTANKGNRARQIQERVPGTADLATYDTNNTTGLPGVFVCDETNLACTSGADPDADKAHQDAKGTYDMYWNWHGRDSLNGAGMQLISTVHYDSGYCNAGWTGAQMIYGDGCPTTIVLDDVVGHELTHGVTEFTSGLVYAFQSGAINESFSDVWGEFYDLTNGSADDTPANRWKLAEPLDGNGIRNMKDPTLFGDPDRMLSANYYTGTGDNGGVHINSGVNNKAAYLMVDGATFNGQTVTGIGIPKTVAIYYDVQTTKLTGGSEYYDLGKALAQACRELVGGAEGITSTDCDQVDKATLATEMHTEVSAAAATAAICPADFPTYLFNDGLESGGANWTTGATTGANAWTVADNKNELVGLYSNRGDDLETTSASFVAMAASVTLPADAYLHFTHRFSFETSGGTFWDGGIVEYSTNGGSSWTQLPSAGFYQAGINYGGTISTIDNNPLEGKSAFVARSGAGLGSTRYTLATLGGQNVRFRWVIGSDSIVSAPGWRIDDIKIYTCGAAPTSTPTNTVPATATATDVPPTETATETPTDVPATSTATTDPGSTATATTDPGSTATATNDPSSTATATTDLGSTATATTDPGSTATATEPVETELLTNGGFETDTNLDKVPDGWTGSGLLGDKQKCNKPGKVIAFEGECVFHFKGGAGENSKLSQNPDVTGLVANDTLTLAGYGNASGAPNTKIKVRISYTDTSLTKGKITVKLNAATSDWTAFSGTLDVVLADVPTSIKVILQNKSLAGKVRLDALSLLHTTGGSALLPLP